MGRFTGRRRETALWSASKGTDMSRAIEVLPDWERVASLCLADDLRKILVIGAADRGKSTFCRFLVSRLARSGARVAFLDSDVGQKDLGPPATLTRGFLRSPSDPDSLEVDALYFVGSTSPLGHLLPMVAGVRDLADSLTDTVVVINTTGFIHGAGYVLKSYKIEMLHPDLIIAVDPGEETAAITYSYSHCCCVRLLPSPRVVPKSRELRRAARQKAFARYFQASSEISLDIRDLTFQRDPEFIAALAGNRMGAGVRLRVPHSNLLCGLCDREGHCLGLGILDKVGLGSNTISFLTPVPKDRIRIVQFGDLYLKPDGEELGRK